MITQSAKGTDGGRHGGDNNSILGNDLKFLFFLFYISQKTIFPPSGMRDHSKNHRAICAIAFFKISFNENVIIECRFLKLFASSTTLRGTDLGQ